MDERTLLEEYEVRQRHKVIAASKVEQIMGEVFETQKGIILDSNRNKAVLGTRRAGKTETWGRYIAKVALENPRCLIRVWAINRTRCMQLIWDPLLLLFARHQIKTKNHETLLTIKLENGSEIRLLGADKDKEAQKKRGDKTILEIVLEAQLFGSYLRTLVEEIAEPCLFDLKGTFCMEGTPGAVETGYWHDVSGHEDFAQKWISIGSKDSNGAPVGRGWSLHHLNVLNNPHLPHAKEELAALKKRRNWADDNPTYIREWLGRWVNDLGSLFYKYDPIRNSFDLQDVKPWGPGWQHTLGWDLGSRDDMAITVWGWHPSKSELYEAFSWKAPGALAKEVMGQIAALEAKGFNFVKKVADTQGGGKMYVEEVMSRYSQVFEPAKKNDKYDHVVLMNDDLLTGHIKLMSGSVYSQEIAALVRDLDWPPEDKPNAPPREDPRCANHNCFIAGTQISTWKGLVPIEEIKVGDLLRTRSGWNLVTKCAPTGIEPVFQLGNLTGTADHPIWTNRGWVSLDSVVASDSLLYLCKNGSLEYRRLSNGLVTPGNDIRPPNEDQTASISSEPKTEKPSGFIARFGQWLTEKSHQNTTSTTSTKTQTIIDSRTLLASPGKNTFLNTPAKTIWRILRSTTQVWKKLVSSPLYGTHPQWVGLGTPNTGDESLISCAKSEPLPPARFAATSSSQEKDSFVAALATPVAIALGTSQKVYALTVENEHEYFANGVLVSNCDAGLYSYRAARHYLHEEIIKKPKIGSKEWAVAEAKELEEYDDERNQGEWWEVTRLEDEVG